MFAARGTFLFDEAGQPLLDLVNNPASLGHCHRTVVAAAAQQMAVLNTNTRYVYPELADYAEALTATLPEKLSVCYFVNSGSEANDLALRIARQYTQGEGVVCVEGAYHGHTAELVKISPYKFDGKGGFPQPPTTEKASSAATSSRGCPLLACLLPTDVLQHPASWAQVPLFCPLRGRHRDDANPGAAYAEHVATAIARLKERGVKVEASQAATPPTRFLCTGTRAARLWRRDSRRLWRLGAAGGVHLRGASLHGRVHRAACHLPRPRLRRGAGGGRRVHRGRSPERLRPCGRRIHVGIPGESCAAAARSTPRASRCAHRPAEGRRSAGSRRTS